MKNNKFKGTPGPWIEGDCSVYAENDSDIAAVYDGQPTSILDMNKDVAQANARLIAAAPELLEAAKSALENWGTLSQLLETHSALEAAVNKALGTNND